MIIQNVRLQRSRNKTLLVADCKIRRIGVDTVYFSFDCRYDKYVFADASPFAAALLIPSMKQGENLIIHGSISEKLYVGMNKIIAIMSSWDVGLKKIEIKADKITKDKSTCNEVGTFFSGGVDSFYTYLKHKNDKDDILKNFILVNGYDIDKRNVNLWDMTRKNIIQIANKESVNLIEVESNIRQLIEPIISWDYSHGGCLAAVGLCLRYFFKKIYIPSGRTVNQQKPWGSHLETDKLWSAENILFEHDGTEASRVDKVVWQIAKSETALKHLRVCYMNIDEKYNCGNCDKCLRTMVNLLVAGKLDECETLPHTIDLNKTLSLVRESNSAIFHQENLDALRNSKIDPKLQRVISDGLKNKKHAPFKWTNSIVKKIHYIDHVYFGNFVYKYAVKIFGKKFVINK